MSVVLAPSPVFTGFGFGGLPVIGGTLSTFVAGTSTPQVTYVDSTQTTPNANPIQLNSNAQANIWLVVGLTYKLVLKDASGNLVWTVDQVPGGLTIDSITALIIATINSTVTQSFIGVLLYPQTPTETTLVITPTAFQYPEGDIRRYGATTVSADNHVAINNALLISAAGGSAAYIPPGTWAYTSTLNTGSVTYGQSSMYGAGDSSVLAPTAGVDGLTFVIDTSGSGTQGSRFFRDFMIIGPSTTSSSANGINLPSTGRITGIKFDNLTVRNFAVFVNQSGAGGVWDCAFNNCYGYNNYQGYNLQGFIGVMQIMGGRIQTGAMTGSGNRIGINLPNSNQQSIHVFGLAQFGYDIGAAVAGVFVDFESVDMSNCNISAYVITSESGQVTIHGGWAQLSNTAIGPCIQISDQGAEIDLKVVVDSVQLLGNAVAGTIGVYCGANQFGISITNNTIGSVSFPFDTGVGGTGGTPAASSANLVCKFNTIYATTNAISANSSCVNAEIGPNFVKNGAIAISGIGAGLNYIQNNVPMRGTAVFAGTTTSAVTFTNAMPLASYQIKLSQSASSALPPWWTSKATGGFTINFSANFTGSVDWEVSL